MTLGDSRNKARALGRIKRLASAALPLDPFVTTVFELFNDAVPHSPNRVILAGGGDRIDAYMGSTEEIARAAPLFHQYFVDSPPPVCGIKFPYDAHALRNVLPSKVIWTQADLALENLYRAEGYNVVYRPLGWHHLLQVVFQESGEFFGYYPIWRTADQKPFSRDDIEFLRNAAPHVAHGLRAARLLERNEVPYALPGEFQLASPWRPGVILLDAGGELVAIDPYARLVLQQLGVLDGVTVDQFAPGPVRDGLAYVSSKLAEIFRGTESESERAGAPVYRIYHHWTGIVLRLRGVQMTATDGREYTTVLVERGETAGARRRRISARWGLSQREAQILSLIGDSKTGPEIALLLAISHNTVRKHTSKILDKLGVETRTAAATIALDTAPIRS
jgi:DNA-binding CsgD family transcriptional regulator